MAYTTFIPSEFRVVDRQGACIECGRCVQQCGWGVYTLDEDEKRPIPDHSKCSACHRCVTFCPAGAITIKKNALAFKESDSMSPDLIKAIWRQAETGGVLLTGMGNDSPTYASSTTCCWTPARSPTRPSTRCASPWRCGPSWAASPTSSRWRIGRTTGHGQRSRRLMTELDPQLQLETPIMFGGMSFGSVSLNVHRALAMAAKESGTFMNTGEGGLHADLEPYQDNIIVQCASGRFGVRRRLPAGGRGRGDQDRPGRQAGHRRPPARARRSTSEVSITRMIPQGTDALSPAPHHDIYSIEDLRQLIYALKEATGYKPVSVKIACVHNVAAIASGVVRAGADIVYLDGFRGGTGAAPTIIRDHVGIPIEIAIATVDQRLRDEGIRNRASIVAAGGIRSSADVAKAIALGRRRLRHRHAGSSWPSAATSARSATPAAVPGASRTQRPELTRRLDPEWGAERVSTWSGPGATRSRRSSVPWASTPSRACAGAASACVGSGSTRPPWTSSA